MSSAVDSDFECLRINIWSPPDAHLQQSKLLVFVWIHSGRFAVGNGNTHYGRYSHS
ncbi:MAG: hypothetical protein EOO61_01895 [Hymenobacter sp.]|nr:MAG: hypothetical protein EOO61_01895 [Hymenobacter sp.]